MYYVDYDKAQDQRDGCNKFEIDERLDTHPADFLHVPHLGYTNNDGAEDDGTDHHLDHFNEAYAERFQLLGNIGVNKSQRNTDYDTNRNLKQE